MQYSGYDKEVRYDVYQAARSAYEAQIQRSRDEDVPLYRPKTWKKIERKKRKIEKKRNWYKTNGNESVIFVPCTPKETLKKVYEREIEKSPFKIKVVERSGRKLKDILHKKDPFKSLQCGRNDCFVCTSNGKGDCTKENVTYIIQCTENFQKKDIYPGETS